MVSHGTVISKRMEKGVKLKRQRGKGMIRELVLVISKQNFCMQRSFLSSGYFRSLSLRVGGKGQADASFTLLSWFCMSLRIHPLEVVNAHLGFLKPVEAGLKTSALCCLFLL